METLKNLTTQLKDILEHQVRIYQSLLSHLIYEKELLVKADLASLISSNQAKEVFLEKARQIEDHRIKTAEKIGHYLNQQNITSTHPLRLLEISEKVEEGDSLKVFHKTLTLLIERIIEQNRENKTYAESALKNIKGALDDVRGTLQGKSTYHKKGKIKQGPEKAGNLVSREA